MVKKVVWMPQTIKDLDSIAEYISRDSQFYASSFIDKLIDTGESLTKHSQRGRVVPEKNDESVRELFVSEYRIIYKVEDTEVKILTIIHGRRNVKKLLSKKV